ncbi:malonyl-CoA decarboxylase, mitochondrial isoform X1 [Cucurbita moschata]|uniref:Malonyl-CoA decarboxylase, mitochondrial isoform X1 n=1 Tax=Cucurbita moschata TaxID=3662 RepID=A0A6J1EMS2_CUCMO|nr:malonyl-CoA decarboxylase, mitochondrial isoform X1 [Cucurbita moschata]
MNKKGLAILMRTRMRPNNDLTKLSLSPLPNRMQSNPQESSGRVMEHSSDDAVKRLDFSGNAERDFDIVRGWMHSAISMKEMEGLDAVLNDFSKGYFSLSLDNRRKLLRLLAKEYDFNRTQVRALMKQYLGLELPSGDNAQSAGQQDDTPLSAFYHLERNLRHALKPTYEVLFERLNTHPGGLGFLSILRADILSILEEENTASLRALDTYLKEKLSMWLSPAVLELHQITWDDPASLLEKIVAYEAVHPISNLIDLKRRLGVGRRCFGYLHPAIPGEPLIFIEVALLKNVAQTVQEVLWDDPPIPESEATCALFYSISSTKPGLSGINLGKFLIKRVITLVKRDMPFISTFATLSPIPGFMQWLLSKLASQSNLDEVEVATRTPGDESVSTFWENILEPEEERLLIESSEDFVTGKNGMEIMFKLLTLSNHEWISSTKLLSALKRPLMRLCARYLVEEKKRGKALDSVANFHLQNGAIIERLNWMADRSVKGLLQSGGIMVNYVYRMEKIEEYAHSYFSTGQIHSSPDILRYVETKKLQDESTE